MHWKWAWQQKGEDFTSNQLDKFSKKVGFYEILQAINWICCLQNLLLWQTSGFDSTHSIRDLIKNLYGKIWLRPQANQTL
jgi:hypothetical protein